MQAHTDGSGAEVTAAELYDLFEATYLGCVGPVELKDWHVSSDDTTEITVTVNGIARTSTHRGVGPVEALTQALADVDRPVEILSLTQQSIGATAVTYLEHRGGWSCGRSDSVLTASLAAVIRAANAP